MSGDAEKDLIRASAARLLEEAEALSAALSQQIAAEVPELAADPVLAAALARSVLDNVAEAGRRLARGDAVVTDRVPEAALAYARRLAERDIPASALLRAYRLGQAHAQEQAIQALSASGADPAEVVAATRTLSAVGFAYVDGISEQVVNAHEAARRRWLEGTDHARPELVAALLADRAEQARLLARELGYQLDHEHVAVVVWTDGDELVRPRVGSHALVVPVDSTTVWAWLPRERESVVRSLPEDVWVARSEPLPGPDGFMQAHRQARRVQALVSGLGPAVRPRVTDARDVRLPLLLDRDRDAAGAWIAQALGGLAAEDEAHARLRETLRVFLEEGGSYAGAATRLGVHRNTVLYRVRRAETAMGHPVRENRVEVEAALLAARWLGSRLSPPDAR